MAVVTNESEIQRLRHIATQLSEGLGLRSDWGADSPKFFGGHSQRFPRSQNGQVSQRSDGGRNTADAWWPWGLDSVWD